MPALAAISPLKPEVLRGTDIMIVRELIGGLYVGTPRGIETVDGVRRGVNTMIYSEPEIERIARAGVRAGAHPHRSPVFGRQEQRAGNQPAVARGGADACTMRSIATSNSSHLFVDNAAMQLVRAPSQFDVLLMENLFGDILSDIGAAVAGSIGMLPSASMNGMYAGGEGRHRALYEPIHGSAPDIAGKGIANPCGAILSFAMCLRHTFLRPDEAAFLEAAVTRAIEGGARTPDIALPGQPPVSTAEMGDSILRRTGCRTMRSGPHRERQICATVRSPASVLLKSARYGSAPLATMLLADFGADVIKVEPPQGDLYRGMPPIKDGELLYFAGVNRNKRGIALDLKTDDGRDALLAVLKTADVIIENLRPGVMARLGIGPKTLLESHPHLIFCSISGYGQDGPIHQEGAYDLIIQGYSGMMAATGDPDGEPVKLVPAVPDVLSAQQAAFSILAALRAREATGRGQHIDIALLDVSLYAHDADLSARPVRNRSGAAAAGLRTSGILSEPGLPGRRRQVAQFRRQRPAHVARVLQGARANGSDRPSAFRDQRRSPRQSRRAHCAAAADLQDAQSRRLARGSAREQRAIQRDQRCRRGDGQSAGAASQHASQDRPSGSGRDGYGGIAGDLLCRRPVRSGSRRRSWASIPRRFCARRGSMTKRSHA